MVAVGDDDNGQCDVDAWTDIVAVSAGGALIGSHTVGLKSDGTVVATKYTGVRMLYFGWCDVASWKLFNNFSTLEAERAEQARRAEEETRRRAEEQARRAAEQARLAEQARQQRLAALAAEETRLQNELASLRGLFTGKRRREIEERLAAIRSEKTNLAKR